MLDRPEREAGVRLVDDVSPYEKMKLRLLNASHQGLCYFAYLAGYRLVHESAQDPLIADLLSRYLDSEAMPTLATRLQPGMARWAPYYSPALFQSLEAPRSADLRFEMRPIFTPAMALAERRGQALLSLLTTDGVCRNDVAVVLDLAGPEAVAVASALAHCFDPVFVFDNWPHPRGVVPAHQALAAAAYYQPLFARHASNDAGSRPKTTAHAAPPMIVLDRHRLDPYTDDSSQFDNRHVARVPGGPALKALGIAHVLYVSPTGADHELDDHGQYREIERHPDRVAEGAVAGSPRQNR